MGADLIESRCRTNDLEGIQHDDKEALKETLRSLSAASMSPPAVRVVSSSDPCYLDDRIDVLLGSVKQQGTELRNALADSVDLANRLSHADQKLAF